MIRMMITRNLPTPPIGSHLQSVLASGALALAMVGSLSWSLQSFFANSFEFNAVSESRGGIVSALTNWKLSDETDANGQLEELVFRNEWLRAQTEQALTVDTPVSLEKPVRIAVKTHRTIKAAPKRVLHARQDLPREGVPSADAVPTAASVIVTEQSSTAPLTTALTVYQVLAARWNESARIAFQSATPDQRIQIATTQLDAFPESAESPVITHHEARSWTSVSRKTNESSAKSDRTAVENDSSEDQNLSAERGPEPEHQEVAVQSLPDSSLRTKEKVLTLNQNGHPSASAVAREPSDSKPSFLPMTTAGKMTTSIMGTPSSIKIAEDRVTNHFESAVPSQVSDEFAVPSSVAARVIPHVTPFVQPITYPSVNTLSHHSLNTQNTPIAQNTPTDYSDDQDANSDHSAAELRDVNSNDHSINSDALSAVGDVGDFSESFTSSASSGAGTVGAQATELPNSISPGAKTFVSVGGAVVSKDPPVAGKVVVTIPPNHGAPIAFRTVAPATPPTSSAPHLLDPPSANSQVLTVSAPSSVLPATGPAPTAPATVASAGPNSSGASARKPMLLSERNQTSDQTYKTCQTGNFGKRAVSKLPIFQNDLSVCKRILSYEGESTGNHSQWIEARVTEDVPGEYYPTIAFQKWATSDTVFGRIPILSRDDVRQFELLTGTHVQTDLGIVMGEITDEWTPEWSGRAERPIFLSENFERVDPIHGEHAKYFVFLNVKAGANLLTMKGHFGQALGAIAPIVKSGMVTYLKPPKATHRDVALRALDGNASKEVGLGQVTIDVIGQPSKTSLTKLDGTAVLRDVIFYGDYPTYIDLVQSIDSFRHRFQVGLAETDHSLPLFLFDNETVGHWLAQVDQGVSKDSGLVIGVRGARIAEDAHSYLRLFKMEGAVSLREETYGILRGDGLKSEAEMSAETPRFLMTQVAEGMHVLGDFSNDSRLRWSETIIAQPGVINVTRPH